MNIHEGNGPAHEILVLFAFSKKPPINTMVVDESCGARGMNFGLILHLDPYFVYASSKSSGKFLVW